MTELQKPDSVPDSGDKSGFENSDKTTPEQTLRGLRVTARDIGRPVFVKGYGEGLLLFWGIYRKTGRPRAGVAFNRPIGLNNGTIQGFVYFRCPSRHGVLVEPGKVMYLTEGAIEAALSAGLLLTSDQVGHISQQQMETSDVPGTCSTAYATVPVRSGPVAAKTLLPPVNLNSLNQPEDADFTPTTSPIADLLMRYPGSQPSPTPSNSFVTLDSVSISSAFSIISMTPFYDCGASDESKINNPDVWSVSSRNSRKSTCSSACSSLCQEFVHVTA